MRRGRYRPTAYRVIRFWRIVRRDGRSLVDTRSVPFRWVADRARALPFLSRREAEIVVMHYFAGAAAAREHGICAESA